MGTLSSNLKQNIGQVIKQRPFILDYSHRIGLDADWIKQEHNFPLIFGPAEQCNPFFTVYSYAVSGKVTPKDLKEELKQEKEVEKQLNEEGFRVLRQIISLRNDSFSSGGPTAKYGFVVNNEMFNLFSKKERNYYSHMPFSVPCFSRKKLEELETLVKKTPEVEERIIQAKRLFLYDLAESSRISSSGGNINYLNFCEEYNKRSLSFFTGSKLDISFLDDTSLKSFLSEGVSSWKSFLHYILGEGFIDSTDPLFRLKVKTNEGERFCRLGLDQLTDEDSISLKNLDFNRNPASRESYNLKEIVHDPSLFVASGLEYFLVLGGFTRFCLGDDGVFFDKLDRIKKKIEKEGILPSSFIYSPHNILPSNEEEFKKAEYLLRGEDVLEFYKFRINPGE